MPMRLPRAAGTGLLLALALTACVPSAVTRSPQEIAAARQAEALAREGQFDQAAQAWLQLASQSRAPDIYRLHAAEAYREEGALDRMAPLLEAISADRLQGEERTRYELLRAELALSRQDAATALQLTTRPDMAVPPALRPRLLELRARAMAASGDLWGAAHTRVEMDPLLTGLDRDDNRQRAIALLDQLGVGPLKRRAAAMQAGDVMLPWVAQALNQLGVAVALPQPTLGAPVGTLLPGAEANVREGYRMPERVALMLPISSQLASAARAVREGFFSAYASAADTHAPRAAVHVYDSGGSADTALAAYRQAVADGAQLVVGPLTRDAVAAVLGQSALPVPVLALNRPDDNKLPPAGVTEFGLLPETEGAQVADHMVERGLHDAYVIVSSDDFAQRAASAFRAEFEARGGHLAGRATLPAGVNYKSTLAGFDFAGGPPDAGIFISMRPQQARLLLPQLKVAQIGLPVFGTSHIYGGSADPSDDRDLDGVEFVDAPWLFDAQPGLPDRATIAARLPAAQGTAARLFAFGMDAWNLVPYLGWLHDHSGSYMPGATGQLTADPFGQIRRVLVWAVFQDGVAHPLGGSLQLDDVPSGAPPPEQPEPVAPTPAAPAAPATQPAPATSTGPH